LGFVFAKIGSSNSSIPNPSLPKAASAGVADRKNDDSTSTTSAGSDTRRDRTTPGRDESEHLTVRLIIYDRDCQIRQAGCKGCFLLRLVLTAFVASQARRSPWSSPFGCLVCARRSPSPCGYLLDGGLARIPFLGPRPAGGTPPARSHLLAHAQRGRELMRPP
jgi:hypothetical protein